MSATTTEALPQPTREPFTAEQTRHELWRGLTRLTELDDDRATEINRVGFSKLDAAAGRRLASENEAYWDAEDVIAAWRIAVRYRRTQLTWLDWDRMVQPVIEAPVTRGVRRRDNRNEPRTVTVAGDDLLFTFGYDPAVKEDIRAAGGRWDKARTNGFEASAWTVRPTPTRIDALSLLIAKHGFTVDDAAIQLVERLFESFQKTVDSSRAKETLNQINIPGLWGGAPLRPYQYAGIEFLVRHERTIIADDMGIGKTLQALCATKARGAWPVLVVCPAVVKLNWAVETRMWFPTANVSILSGRPGSRAKTPTLTIRRPGGQAPELYRPLVQTLEADVVIINYDVLHAWSAELMAKQFIGFIADEAHYLKSLEARRTQIARLIATGWDAKAKKVVHKGIPVRILATGTPVMNRPIELPSLLYMIGRMGTFGTMRQFLETYTYPVYGGFGVTYEGGRNLNDLNAILRGSGALIRRTKDEVLTELPGKARVSIPVELTNAAEYERAERDVARWIGQAKASATGDVSAAVEAEEKARRAETLVRFGALRQLAAEGKREAIIDWAKEFLSQTDRKLVVFGYHVATVTALAEALSAPRIDGSTKPEDRQAIVQAFQNDPTCRVVCCQIRAGGVGITLTAASDVAFAELDWTPAMHDQAEDRCYRLGQTRPVTAWYFIGNQTIDDEMWQMIESKRALVTEATDGDEEEARSMLAAVMARFAPKTN